MDKRRGVIIILSLFILIIIFFYPVFFKGYVLLPLDILSIYSPWNEYYKNITVHNYIQIDALMLYYPWRKYAVDCIKKGVLPLWNPYSFCGTPYLANPQSGLFYPLNILFYILPIEYAYTYQIILHLLLAGIFMYFYLRIIKLTYFSSFIGAFLFMFNPFFIAWLVFPTFIGCAIYLPLIFLLIEKLSEKMKLYYAILISIILSISFFAGHPQIFFYVSLATVLYLGYKFYLSNNKIKFCYLILLTIIVTILLSSIQLLPTLEFTSLIVRGKEKVTTSIIPFKNIILFFIPNFFGSPVSKNFWATHNYTEFYCYSGILTLFLAIFGILNKKNKNNLFFTISLILFFIIVFIPFMSKLIFNLPLFNRFRGHNRIIYLYSFFICIMVSQGIDYIINNRKNILLKFTFIFGIFLIIILLVWYGIIYELNLSFVPLFKFQLTNLKILLIFILGSLFIFFNFYYYQNIKIFQILILIIIFADIFIAHRNYNVIIDPKKINFIETESIKLLRKDNEEFRIARAYIPVSIIPNTSLIYKIPDAEGCDTFILKDYGKFLNNIYPQKEALYKNFVAPLVRKETYNSQLIDFLNIKYVLTTKDINNEKYELLLDDKDTKLYKNKGYFNRAFIVYKAKMIKDKNKILNELKNINLKEEVIIELSSQQREDRRQRENALTTNHYPLPTIIKYSPNEVIISANLSKSGYLVLSDVYYPGWQVYVDNKKDKIYKANYCFRAVKLNKGKHKVRFVFNPKSYKIGLYITSVTLLLIVVLFIINLKYRKL